MESQLELVVDSKSLLGESPSWDSEQNVLYWVDIDGKKVHIYDPALNQNRTISLEQRVGAVAPRNSGGVVLASESGFYVLDLETEKLSEIAKIQLHETEERFNDGKCDAAGRFWAGTMSSNGETNSKLYCLEQDGNIRTVMDRVAISNGLCWSRDNGTMYYIDSGKKEIASFDYDIERGSLQNKKVVVTFPEGVGGPDGMTIDEEGMIWVAHWGGSQVSRWNPTTGQMLQSVPVPAPNVTSCVFGGRNLDELYITTSGMDIDQSETEYPYAGGLFRIRTKVKGLPTAKF